jgi:hypothetical protein
VLILRKLERFLQDEGVEEIPRSASRLIQLS